MSPNGQKLSGWKRLPRWLRYLLVAMVFLVAAGLIIPYFLDVDRYRTVLAGLIENETGRKVTIGKIRARFLPTVGFVVEDFRLGNPAGFAEGNVLTAEAIRGNLAWGPLLRREFRLSSVELVRPKLLLLEDERGQTNYSLTPKAASGRASSARETAAASQPPEVENLELTDAEVTLGQVAGRSRAAVPSLHVRKINAELTNVKLSPAGLKEWQGQANLSGVVLELPGWKDPLVFRSGKLTLRDGRLDSEFRLGFGKAPDWKGNLRVADIERGLANFELSTPQLDVDQLLAAQTPEKAPPAPGRVRPQRSELVAQGRLTAERLVWQPYTTGRGAAEVRIFSDRAELWPVTVELYGGTIQVSARADRTQSPERFSANVQLRSLDVGRMLSDASPELRGKMAGVAEMDLQLLGSLGSSWGKSLTGTGRFAVRDGRLPGLNLAGSLGVLAKVSGVAADTPFRVIEGDLSVGESRISSRNIHMDSPRGTLDMHGSCALDGALDYEGQAVLVNSPDAAGGAANPTNPIATILGGVLQRNVSRITVPFSLRGTLRDPKVRSGRGLPTIESPSPTTQSGTTQQQKKSIVDLLRRPQ